MKKISYLVISILILFTVFLQVDHKHITPTYASLLDKILNDNLSNNSSSISGYDTYTYQVNTPENNIAIYSIASKIYLFFYTIIDIVKNILIIIVLLLLIKYLKIKINQ